MKSKAVLLASALVCLSVLSAGAQTSSSSEVPDEWTDQARFDIAACLTAGVVIGEAPGFSIKVTDRIFYGGAVGLEYRVTELLTLGASFEMTWKDMTVYHVDAIRSTGFSGSALVRLSRNLARTAYVRAELGRAAANWRRTPGSSSIDVGSHTFGRLGLGVLGFGISRTSARFEAYYRLGLSDGKAIDYPGLRIDPKTDGPGLEFVILFHL